MIYDGRSLSASVGDDGIAVITFDARDATVNTLGHESIRELDSALSKIDSDSRVKGLLFCSAKKNFIVGADITEFDQLFDQPSDKIETELLQRNKTLNRIEDFRVPTAAAISGLALGGGVELCLATDTRLISIDGSVGFPEVQLGILPGYGGTVRLPRIIGVDHAVEWIASAKNQSAQQSLETGLVDAVVPADELISAGTALLNRYICREFKTDVVRQAKLDPCSMDELEMAFAFDCGLALANRFCRAGNTAPRVAVETMQAHASLGRSRAQIVEGRAASQLARSDVAKALVMRFLAEQAQTRRVSTVAKNSKLPRKCAVLGAWVMGGSIAYLMARKGYEVGIKDVQQLEIDVAIDGCIRTSSRLVEKGRLAPSKMAEILCRIDPTLDYDRLAPAEFVVEAVTERESVKATVLQEIESRVSQQALLATNTSTLSVTSLAQNLSGPDWFCGMHFFNPVQTMPLVEIVQGKETSDDTVSRAVAFANSLGKKPVVVQDCPVFW